MSRGCLVEPISRYLPAHPGAVQENSDRLAALISTLHHLNPQAAEDVIQLYLEDEHLWA